MDRATLINRKFVVKAIVQTSTASPSQWEIKANYRNEPVRLYARYRSNTLSVDIVYAEDFRKQIWDTQQIFYTNLPNHSDDMLSEASLVHFTKHLLNWKEYLSKRLKPSKDKTADDEYKEYLTSLYN